MKLNTLVLAGAIALPVQHDGNWQLLEYNRLDANQVTFSEAGIMVTVDQSASPVIYPLDDPKMVSKVSVHGKPQRPVERARC